MANANKVVLIVMDGWGHGPKTDANAIFKARTPFIDSLYANYPNAELLTSGEDVGLPAGQMGNSEVGHLNIGAGRVVYQDLVRINLAIRDGSIFREKTLVEAFAFAKANNKPVHFLGLVSDGIRTSSTSRPFVTRRKKTRCRMFTSMPSPMDAIRIRRVAWVICASCRNT